MKKSAIATLLFGTLLLLSSTTASRMWEYGAHSPREDKAYEEISYRDVMLEELKVMDQTAVTLCKENSLPLIVLNIHKPGAIAAAVRGERVGTLVR